MATNKSQVFDYSFSVCVIIVFHIVCLFLSTIHYSLYFYSTIQYVKVYVLPAVGALSAYKLKVVGVAVLAS